MIIWLASYPRSGNTFFRILLNHIYRIETYSIYDDPLLEKLEGSSATVGHQKLNRTYKEMIDSEQTFFVKTHELPSDNCPAIYLVRDGRDALVSYAHFMMTFRNDSRKASFEKRIKTLLGWNEYQSTLKYLIVNTRQSYGSWSENVNQWLNRDGKTFAVKFEDLIENPFECAEKAIYSVSTFGDPIVKGSEVPSFEELHAKWPQFFRQGKSGKWQQEMGEDLRSLFWKHHGDVMKALGYQE